MQNSNTYHSYYSTMMELERITTNRRRVSKILWRVAWQVIGVVIVFILSLLGVALYNS